MNILLGILMIFGAFSIMEFPVITGMVLCWVMIGFMLTFGIFAIVRYIEAKNAEKVAEANGLAFLKSGVGSLILGIAAVIIAVIAMTSDTGAEIFMNIITAMFGGLITLEGISFVARGIQLKKLAIPGWVGTIIMGVLIAIAGVFCIISTFTSLVAIGTMFGTSMLMAGVATIFMN